MFLARIFYAGFCLSLLLIAVPSVAVAERIDSPPVGNINSALPTFIKQIWEDSPGVQGAQAKLEAARARTDGANRPLHNPSLELETERTDINTSSIGFSQTLDWSDKQGAQANIAKQEQQAALAAFWEARRNTALEALNALVDYFTADDMRSLTLHRSQLMKTLVDTVVQRQAAGDVTALDVTLAQVAYSEALMSQATTESIFAEAAAALQAVSGLKQSSTHWPTLPDRFSSSATQTSTTSFERLPELIVLRSKMAAAKARIDLVQKEGRIDPTLGIRAGKEDSETLLGLSLEIPLFIRNTFKAEARAASREAVAEEQVYRDAYRRAEAHFLGALSRYKNTSNAWRVWLNSGLQAQRKQMSLLDQLWNSGELSVTEYLIQAKQNIDTQEAAASLLGETLRAHFAWLAASNQVENWLGLEQRIVETNSGESK